MKTPEEIEADALRLFLEKNPELKDVPVEEWNNFNRWMLDAATIGAYRAEVFSQNLEDKYK